MNYYLKIDAIDNAIPNIIAEEIRSLPLWSIDVKISKELFENIQENRFVIIDHDDKMLEEHIEQFESYFPKSVHISCIEVLEEEDQKTVHGCLLAYFIPNSEAIQPF